MGTILGYLRAFVPRMLGGLTIKIFGTLTDLGLPWVLAFMIDNVIPKRNFSMVLIWGGVMLILSVVTRSFNVTANRMASSVARDAVRTVRHDLFQKIIGLSGRQMDEFTVPSLVSRMTTDTYNLHQVIGMVQRLGVRTPLILIGGIAITFTLDTVLTFVLIGTLPLISVVVYFVSRKGIPLYSGVQKSADKMIRIVRENITGVRVIKALSKGESEKERFAGANQEMVDKEVKASSTMAVINPSMSLLLNLGLVLVIVFGALRVDAGVMKVGKIVAFLSYFTMILNAMISINRIFTMLSKASASAGRISQVLLAPVDLVVVPSEKEETPYHIEFRHVSFAYNKRGDGKPVSDGETAGEWENNITDVDFALRQGESLGIIGSTGSGKTTLVNLLMRFYDVDKGEVKICGQNVRALPLMELRGKFGVVFQNDLLFADSIEGNIGLWREITQARIREAAADAQAVPFIQETEEGFGHMVAAKGANLSGGQKQRVLIARALAALPEILILDDSSSALDYKTDAMLRNAVREKYEGTTSIIIAQRISSVRHLDHIMVLEDGRVAGYGTHDMLLAECETYQEIYESQMGGGDFGGKFERR